VLSSISFLGAQHWTRAAVRQGFIAERELMKPIKRLHDPSLSRGRTVVALRKLSARRLARRQTAHLSNHQNHHSKVTRACANVYTRMHIFFRVRSCANPKFGIKTRLRTHTRIVGLGRGRDSSESGVTPKYEFQIQTPRGDPDFVDPDFVDSAGGESDADSDEMSVEVARELESLTDGTGAVK